MSTHNFKTIGCILGGVAGITRLALGIGAIIDEFSTYDRDGFDKYGYDRQGYDREGYDHNGRDKRGFNRNGFDSEGYDCFGCDSDGYKRNGFDIDGFNREGFDWQGYGRDYNNVFGIDRAGHSRQYYSDYLYKLRKRLDDAYDQLKNGEIRYAIYDARIVMEQTLRMIVQHAEGGKDIDDRMLISLKKSENYYLLDDMKFLERLRLHEVRRICNANGHELDAEDSMSHKKVHFVIMQINDLIDTVERSLLTKNN